MAAENLEWLTINDFRPGIAQVPGIHHALGTAVEDGTYGCIANDSGALVPMPGVSRIITAEPPDVDPEELTSRFWITGFSTLGPIIRDDFGFTIGEEQNDAELWFGFEWFESRDGNSYREKSVRRYLRAFDTPIWQEITSGSWIDDSNADTQGQLPWSCQFGYTTANPDDNTLTGMPVVIICFERLTSYFPDFDSPGTISLGTIPKPDVGLPQPIRMVCHQGRVVIFPYTVWQHGGQNAVVFNSEGFYWTKVNNPEARSDITGSDMGFNDGRFQSENPTGWQQVASLTANELFLMKGRGGAVMIRGDLDDPTVVALPNVQSSGRSLSEGTNSPIGYIYTVVGGGAWVWSGGDTSTNISRQMLPDFWAPTSDEDYYLAWSKCALWREWAIIPNGWLFDTDHMGWWKYATPEMPVFNFAEADWSGRWLYATPLDFTTQDPTVCYEFDRRQPRNEYSWKSHPVMAGANRQFQAREIILSGSGQGEVVVSVISRDGTTTSRQFRFDHDYPEAIQKDISIEGSHLQIQIFSHGDAGHPAPTVYEVRLGTQKRQRIDRGKV